MARSIETIVEVSAPGLPAAPLLPQPIGPESRTAGPQRPFAPAMPVRGNGDIPTPTGPTGDRSHRSAPGTAEELPELAPLRSLRRSRPDAGGPQGSGFGRGDLPAAPPPQPPPVIHVTIGRIEVRATPARTPAPVQASRPSGPKLGLDEYLKSRTGRAV